MKEETYITWIKYLILSILFFTFIFDPPFKFIPGSSGKIAVCLGLLWLGGDLLLNRNLFISSRSLFLLFGSLLLYFFTATVALLYGTHDFTLAKAYLFFIIECQLGASFLVHLTRKWLGNSPLLLFKIMTLITSIQAFFVVIMFVSPAVKDFIQSLLKQDSLDNINEMFDKGIIPAFRGLGLAKNVFYDFSVIQSFGLFAIVILSIYGAGRKLILYSFLYLLITASIILSARTGLVGAAFTFILLIVVTLVRSVFFKGLTLYPGKFMRCFFCVTLLSITTVYLCLPTELKTSITEDVIPFAFEMFVNDSGDGMKTESSEGLKSMYFKVETKTLIMGDGFFADPMNPGQYYKMTDSGFMRHILYYGIIGSAFLYLFWLFIFRVLILDNLSKERLPLLVFYVVLMAYCFLIHVKGDFLANSLMGVKFLFLCFLFSYPGNSKLNDVKR